MAQRQSRPFVFARCRADPLLDALHENHEAGPKILTNCMAGMEDDMPGGISVRAFIASEQDGPQQDDKLGGPLLPVELCQKRRELEGSRHKHGRVSARRIISRADEPQYQCHQVGAQGRMTPRHQIHRLGHALQSNQTERYSLVYCLHPGQQQEGLQDSGIDQVNS
eukprot:scaffold1218_cov393-Prasinococcus_capsulatus_cf.AAC.6